MIGKRCQMLAMLLLAAQPLYSHANTTAQSLDRTEYCRDVSNIAELSMKMRQANNSLPETQRYFEQQFLSQVDLDRNTKDYQLLAAVFNDVAAAAYQFPIAKTEQSKNQSVFEFKNLMFSSCKKYTAEL